MAKRPDASEIEKFKDRVATAFSAFSRLEGDGLVRHVDIGTRPQGPITVLDVRRHLDGLVVEDFSILLGMVKSSFGESIITEDSQDEGKFFDEDDSTIAFGLDQFRSARQGDELIGLRHDGRVLLFTHA